MMNHQVKTSERTKRERNESEESQKEERRRRDTLIMEVNNGLKLTEMLEQATRDEIEADEEIAFEIITGYDDVDVRLSIESDEVLAQVVHQIELTQTLEESVRASIVEDRVAQMARMEKVYRREREQTQLAMAEKVKQLQQWHQQQKNEKVQDFWAVSGRRAGSLTLTVVRAKGLVPRKRNMMSCDTQVVVINPITQASYTSQVHYNSVNPEFEFETYLTLSDDRRPIVINIEGVVPKLGITNLLATARLDLRHKYDNLIRDVSTEQVYTEKGHVEMDTYDSEGRVYPSTSITLKWKLESRHMHSHDFCSECGFVEHRCQCPHDILAAKRAKEYKEMLKQQQLIEAERVRREDETQAALDAKEAEELAAQNEQHRKEIEELLFEEEDGRRRVAHSEATGYLFLLDKALNGATKKMQLAWKVEIAVLAGAQLIDGRDVGNSGLCTDDLHLLLRYMSLWRLNVARAKLRRQQIELLRDLNEEKTKVMKTLNENKRKTESVRRHRNTRERQWQEMEEYDQGKNDLANTQVDHEGIPRATRVRDEVSPQAKLPEEKSKCCIVS